MHYLRVIAYSENKNGHFEELSASLRRAAWLGGMTIGELGDSSDEAAMSRVGGTLELDSLTQNRPTQHEIDGLMARPMTPGRAEIIVVLEFSDPTDLHPGVENIIGMWEENLQMLSGWEARRQAAETQGLTFTEEQPQLDCSGISMDTWVAVLGDYSFKF